MHVLHHLLFGVARQMAGTHSIHYGPISDHIFKFSPVRANAEDLKRFHGTNERLGVDNYADAIRFHHRLISEVSAAPLH